MGNVTAPDWDVVVVGAGLGGAVAALRLAEHGLRVLVLEAGDDTRAAAADAAADRRGIRARLAPGRDPDRWPGPLACYSGPGGRARPIEAVLGRGPGGSSAIYGAALGRLRRSDFAEGVAADGAEAPLPNAWPIDFDGFRPYYGAAEALLRVVGTRDPLDPDDDSRPGAPPPLSPRDAAIRAALASNGLHPFRLRVGIDYLPGCRECLGRRCPLDCKADGASRALARALATGRARLETGLAVQSIARGRDGLSVRVRGAAGEAARTARDVVLAAGALNTPLVLARSAGLWGAAGPPALLGRGLMFHVSDVFSVHLPRRLSPEGPRKTLALRDFYGGGDRGLGEIQSTGIAVTTGMVMSALRTRARRLMPGRLGVAIEGLRPLAWLLAGLLGPAPIFATITEDLPYASNRVWEEVSEAGAEPVGPAPARIALSYAPSAELRRRTGQLRRRIRRSFAPWRVIFLTPPGTPNWGHPMGTCRMGATPETSVVDPDGRLWGQDGLYVADASVFPSSGGVGPALTVAAHALRVADRLAARQGAAAAAAAPEPPPAIYPAPLEAARPPPSPEPG